MPGLVGIFKMSNEDIDINALLTKMSQEMMYKDWYSLNMFVDGPIGLGRVSLGIFNPEPQPIFNEDKTLCIMMDGEIYDYKNLKEDLVIKGHKFRVNNDPEFVLHLYEESGSEAICKLNGSFVLAIWDNNKQELLIANDRFGLRPLYYSMCNGYLVFSSEMKTLLKDDSLERIVDEEAISDFILFRVLLGTKTFFRDFKRLPPASIIICNPKKISIKNYWDFNFQEDKEKSEEYYITKLSELLFQAIDRRLKGNHKIGVALSGGHDSRMVLAAAARKFPSIRAYTWGTADCNDAKFSQQVVRRLGIPHLFLEYRPHDFILFLEKGIYLTEIILDVDSLGMIGKLEKIREFLDVELNGVGDPVIRGINITKQINNCKNEEDFYKVIYNYLAIDLPDNFFNEEFCKRVRNSSQNSLKELLNKYNDNPLSNRAIHFMMREIFPSYNHSDFQIKNHYFERRTPYLDNDLIDFAQRIPTYLRDESYIWTEAFVRLFPDLAGIPLQSTGLPVKPSRFSIEVHNIKKLLKHATSRLFGTSVKSTRLADYTRWLKENQEIQVYIKGILLSEKAKSRGYFNSEAIQGILEEQFAGKKDNWKLITRLITLELWHRIFLDNDKGE